MVTDRMFIIRYEKKSFFFYIKKIKYGTHDTERKRTKQLFFRYNFNNAISQLHFTFLLKINQDTEHQRS